MSDQDLRRYPPVSGECRRIRALLRDYSDGDLAGFLRGEVDEHVHGCRDCGLALSRFELEALRLRKAYAEEQEELAAPEDLTQTILGRVRDLMEGEGRAHGVGSAASSESRGEVDLEDGGEDQSPLPDDFTSKVMDRVRMEWRPQYVHERVLTFMRQGVFLLPLAAVLLVGVLFWSALLTNPESEPVYRLGTLAATTVELPRGSGESPVGSTGADLAAGSQLPSGSTIIVGEAGGASLRLEESGGAVLFRAELESDSQLTLAGDYLLLSQGAAHMQGACDVQLADLARIRLFDSGEGKGVSAHLSLTPVQRVDQALAVEAPMRVHLAVEAGVAEIRRGESVELLVPSGRSAEFDSNSAIYMDRALTTDLLARTRQSAQGPSRDPIAEAAARWQGNLRSSLTGEGLIGVEVELRSQAGEMILRTAADGSFEVPEGFLRGNLAVLRVRWQEGLNGFASYGPEPIDLSRLQGSRLPAIELSEDRPIQGVVRSRELGPLAGARVLPGVVDDVFQLLDALEECAVTADSEGRFLLQGLPVDLDPHQRLVLIAEHEGHATRAFLDLDPATNRSSADLQLILEAKAERRLYGLDPEQSVEIYESIPGLPARALGETWNLRADSLGAVSLDAAGSGPFWYADMQRGVAVELSTEADGPQLEIPYLPGPAKGHRYDWLGTGPAVQFSDTIHHRVMVQGDSQGSTVSGSRIFMREALGRTRFLGLYDGFTGLQFSVMEGREFDLFAFNPSGGLGSLPSSFLPRSDVTVVIKVEESASVALEGGSLETGETGAAEKAEFDPTRSYPESILVRAYRQDAILPGSPFWRQVSAENGWSLTGLPAGSYRAFRVNGAEITELQKGK
ncbi:MAG: zf-HC2 domain-containing protein [Planctomycetota bacterium]|jgi:hypothetical protein